MLVANFELVFSTVVVVVSASCAMPVRRVKKSASTPSAPGVSPEVAALKEELRKLKEAHESELHENNLKVKLLESRLASEDQKPAAEKEPSEGKKEKRGRKRARSLSPSSSSLSSESESSRSLSCESESESSSESSPHRRRRRKSTRKAKKSKKAKSSCTSSGSSKLANRKWKVRRYEKQHEVNATLLRTLKKARRALRKVKCSGRVKQRI